VFSFINVFSFGPLAGYRGRYPAKTAP